MIGAKPRKPRLFKSAGKVSGGRVTGVRKIAVPHAPSNAALLAELTRKVK